MTYSPIRMIIDNKDVRLMPRSYTILDKIDEGIALLVNKGLVKVREIK